MKANGTNQYKKQLYGRRKFQITKWNHSKIKMKLKDSTPMTSQIIAEHANKDPEMDDSTENYAKRSPIPKQEISHIEIANSEYEDENEIDESNTNPIEPDSPTQPNSIYPDFSKNDKNDEPYEDMPDIESRPTHNHGISKLFLNDSPKREKTIEFPENTPVLWTAGFPLQDKQSNYLFKRNS